MTQESQQAVVPVDAEEVHTDGSGRIVSPTHWPLVYHTVRNMKARQLAGIVERKARHAIVPRLPVDFDARYDRRVPETLSADTEPLARNLRTLANALGDRERERYRAQFEPTLDGTFTFLNRTIDFDGGIDWQHEKLAEYTELWLIKLQSFEHLEWLVLGYDSPGAAPAVAPTVEQQFRSWTAANQIGEPQYLRRSWIPHAVSLRILNWSRYAAWADQESVPVPAALYKELYRNALFLSNHVEHGVGGNHLVENGAALIVAGVLFRDHDTGWIAAGRSLLDQAGRRQFLADGGHFERSPMYHIMALRRYITAYDLLSAVGLPTAGIERTAEAALGFLAALSEPAGTIPLLNDSVYAEQPTARACLDYGRACSLDPRRGSLGGPSGSGYRLLTAAGSTVLVDVGTVGPPHLPAHSHNDQLSILLWVDGEPLLTDTGVYDYGNNSRRQYARSVRAHNTAQYDSTEPIPIGGSYLMGRRTSTVVGQSDDQSVRATCQRRSLTGPEYTHRREVAATPTGWTIADSMAADRVSEFTVRYHFHPAVEVRSNDEGVTAFRDGRECAEFQFKGPTEHTLTTTPYFERYGTERQRSSVEVSALTTESVETQISIDGAHQRSD